LAGHLRRPFDQASTTCRGFDVVCRKEVCEHGDRTACTCSHGSLPEQVLGRE
jgi:hypothetical protein